MMKIILVLAFTLTVAVASQQRGVVTPVTPCGGSGTPVQLRIQNCEGAPPCSIYTNIDTLIEGDFIPSTNSALARFRLVAETQQGPITVSDGDLGALVGGQLYTASQTIRIGTTLEGQTIKVILDIYDVASGRIEICVEAPMFVTNP